MSDISHAATPVIVPDRSLFQRHRPLLTIHDLGEVNFDSSGSTTLVMQRIASLIDLARRLHMPVAHALVPNSTSAHLPKGCQPRARDIVFEHPLPSCLSSKEFADIVRNTSHDEIVFCGFRSSTAMASILDATSLGAKAYALTDLLIDDPEDQLSFQCDHAREFVRSIGSERVSKSWPLAIAS